jgi:hypothetical protein
MIALLAQYTQESDPAAGLVGLLILAGIAFIFRAWSANAAERKGIPRSTGWLLGIFLGLLGRIIVGVMRDRKTDQQRLAELNAEIARLDEETTPSRPDR